MLFIKKCLLKFYKVTFNFMLWQIKKEISNEIAQSIHEVRQEQRQLVLDEKIKALTLPNKNHNLEKK